MVRHLIALVSFAWLAGCAAFAPHASPAPAPAIATGSCGLAPEACASFGETAGRRPVFATLYPPFPAGSTGQALLASGNTFAPGAMNLAGGSTIFTGLLPSGNQVAQTMTGDVTGTTSSNTVSKINGTTVPAGGSLTAGNVLQVSGASALAYGPMNLAGGSNYFTGLLPTGNQASQSIGGDGSGTTAALTVTGLRGSALPSLASGYLNYTGSAWALTMLTVGGTNIGGGTEGQLLLFGPSTSGWYTGSGDVAWSTSTPGLATVQQITGSSGTINVIATCSILGSSTTTPVLGCEATVTTTNASATTIYTFAHPNNVVADWTVSCRGRNASNNGDLYRADLSATYQRFAAGGPAIVGSVLTSNTRTNGGGSSYGGPSFSISSNNELLQVTGLASTTIDWLCDFQIAEDT
jgi:hypothetical protein